MLFMLIISTILLTTSNALDTFGECVTPNKDPGTCVRFVDCNLVKSMAFSNTNGQYNNYIRQSQCGYDNNKSDNSQKVLICCPKSELSVQIKPGNVLPDESECGIDFKDKIIGGTITALNEFPWMALILYRNTTDNAIGFICGGTLINSRYVLTAAHCLPHNAHDWVLHGARLGEWNTSTNPDFDEFKLNKEWAPPHQDIAIEQALPHPSYDPSGLEEFHDIALLRLKTPVTYSRFIKPICLPAASNLRNSIFADDTEMEICGWGRINNKDKHSVSEVKQKATVDIKNMMQCQKYSIYGRHPNATYQLCAGGKKTDSCKGDSGGPLMHLKRNAGNVNYYIEGIVSYGPDPCGTETWPGVYTRVGAYVDWITQNLKP